MCFVSSPKSSRRIVSPLYMGARVWICVGVWECTCSHTPFKTHKICCIFDLSPGEYITETCFPYCLFCSNFQICTIGAGREAKHKMKDSVFLDVWIPSTLKLRCLNCCCCLVAKSFLTLLWPHGGLQAPPSMEFPRQESWSILPFPSPGDLTHSGLLHCRQILYCWDSWEAPDG